MKIRKVIIVFIFILSVVFSVSAFETAATGAARLSTYEQQKDHKPIFQFITPAGERLYFNIYWTGIYVGNAVMEAANNKGNIKIKSEVHSAPFISLFYKVENYIESRITNGMPSFFSFKQREGKRRSHKETHFDMNNRKVVYINHRKGSKEKHEIKTDMLWDLMSAFYYLRTQNLEIGKTVYIDVFDSNKFYQAEVKVLKKEKIKLRGKDGADIELDAIVVKPVLKSEGIFKRKGDIFIWLSDDASKTPLKVETEVSIGKVVAELQI
jgi:hypothetical protein